MQKDYDYSYAEIIKKLYEIESRLNKLEIQNAVSNKSDETVEKRIIKIEDTITWIIRLIIGALIMGIITFTLNGGLIIGK